MFTPFTSLAGKALVAATLLLTTAPRGPRESATVLIVTGTVTSGTGGKPIAGAHATIAVAGLSVGTDANGTYRIVVPAKWRGDSVTLRLQAIGFAQQARRIALSHDTVRADFVLKADANALREIVAAGATGAAAVNDAKAGRMNAPSVLGLSTNLLRARKSETRLAGGRREPRDPAERTADSLAQGRSLAGEEYGRIVDNPFRSPAVAPLSTFGVDVDRASYSNVRRIIMVDHQRPPLDAVRIEELVNYFPYQYAPPAGRHPFDVHSEVTMAPWSREHLLVRIGLQARKIDLATAPPNNLVFLIDVSGSMSSDDKLPLLKTAFRLLIDQLREQDRVAIAVYAGNAGLVLPSTSGADKQAILGAIDRLEAGGSTAGGAGIKLAYDIAKAGFLRHGNNRVILATDGDFNVGTTSNAELERLIEDRRREGTAITVLGFGAENIKDNRMEMLADKGNGNYAYIDSPLEARKVFVHEMGGTLVTVAKDVKLQVEFNPAVVAGYRLLGYENRLLRDEDFKDDTKDAGDMGSGHTVTALYEIIPVGASDAARVPGRDSLRYTKPAAASQPRDAGELMLVKLRYKQPRDSVSVPFQHVVANRVATASGDFQFAQAVAAFGMLLRHSDHKGSATPALVLDLAQGSLGKDPGGYRAEFVKLVTAYQALPDVRAGVNRR